MDIIAVLFFLVPALAMGWYIDRLTERGKGDYIYAPYIPLYPSKIITTREEGDAATLVRSLPLKGQFTGTTVLNPVTGELRILTDKDAWPKREEVIFNDSVPFSGRLFFNPK